MRADVMWHDVECGSYEADLALWEELAAEADGPVLDVGAGTGRVSLRLAQAGHEVVALDRDPALLDALRERAAAAGLRVETVVADAASFALPGRRFGLVAVPMQTIQLLPGPRGRNGFFAAARRALAPGGTVALALADMPEAFEDPAELPPPDVGEDGARRYVSQPVAIRLRPDAVRIERVRHLLDADGTRTASEDVVELAVVSPQQLVAEAAAHGLRPGRARSVPATDEHVGSEVVVLHG